MEKDMRGLELLKRAKKFAIGDESPVENNELNEKTETDICLLKDYNIDSDGDINLRVVVDGEPEFIDSTMFNLCSILKVMKSEKEGYTHDVLLEIKYSYDTEVRWSDWDGKIEEHFIWMFSVDIEEETLKAIQGE